MLGTRIVDNLLKQSITDVRPKGNMLKVLLPSVSEEKAAAYLAKLAQCTIDNAFLRTFGNEDNITVGAVNPMVIMQLTLQNTNFSKGSVTKSGQLVQYYSDGNIELQSFDNIYKKVGDKI
jgi:hypothetical protein